jgi:hypothetical protein
VVVTAERESAHVQFRACELTFGGKVWGRGILGCTTRMPAAHMCATSTQETRTHGRTYGVWEGRRQHSQSVGVCHSAEQGCSPCVVCHVAAAAGWQQHRHHQAAASAHSKGGFAAHTTAVAQQHTHAHACTQWQTARLCCFTPVLYTPSAKSVSTHCSALNLSAASPGMCGVLAAANSTACWTHTIHAGAGSGICALSAVCVQDTLPASLCPPVSPGQHHQRFAAFPLVPPPSLPAPPCVPFPPLSFCHPTHLHPPPG